MLNFQGQQLTPFTEAAATQRSGFNALLSLVSGEAQRIEQNRAAAQERAQQLADQKAKELHELNKIAYAQDKKNEGERFKVIDPQLRQVKLADDKANRRHEINKIAYTQDLKNKSAITLANDPQILAGKLQTRKGEKEVDAYYATMDKIISEGPRVNDAVRAVAPNLQSFGISIPTIHVEKYDPERGTFTYVINIQSKNENGETVVEPLTLTENELYARFTRLDKAMSYIPEFNALISEGLSTDDFYTEGSATAFAGVNRLKNVMARIRDGDLTAVDDIERGVINIPSLDQMRNQSAQDEAIRRNLATAQTLYTDIFNMKSDHFWGLRLNDVGRTFKAKTVTTPDGKMALDMTVTELLQFLTDNSTDQTKVIRERLNEMRNQIQIYNDSGLNASNAYINPSWKSTDPIKDVFINKEKFQFYTNSPRSANSNNVSPDVASARATANTIYNILIQ